MANNGSGRCPTTVSFLTACPECGEDAEVHTLYRNADAEATCTGECGEVTITQFYP